MKKILLCCFLSLCITFYLTGTNVYAAENVKAIAKDVFTLYLSTEDKSISPSGIIIDVYSAELAFSDPESGYYEYDELLAFSISVGDKGKIEFKRPSDNFAISLRLDSLPNGYGVEEYSHFFMNDCREYTCGLYKIENVEVEYSDDEIIPIIRSKEGKKLLADVKIKANPTLYGKDAKMIDSKENIFSYNEEVVVSLYEKEYRFDHKVVNTYRNNMDMCGRLYDLGLISELEYIESICDFLLDGDTKIAGYDMYDGTELYHRVLNYSEIKENKISDKIRKVLDQHKKPAETKAQTYAASNDGHFRVYYEQGVVNYNVAKAVADEFQAIDSLFCGAWGFKRPFYKTASSYYRISIVPSGSAGLTTSYSDGSSYIEINAQYAIGLCYHTGISGYPDAYKGILAHEYMHAIFSRYGIPYTNNETIWMQESFASWAGIAYESDYAAYRTGLVQKFLSTTNQPLDYFSQSGIYEGRHYGACLFPLYIQQKMGGVNAIKRILMSYSSTSSPLEAIDLGLSYYGYSLEEAYAGCAQCNFDADYYYNNVPQIQGYKWGSGNIYKTSQYPVTSSNSQSIKRLACHYTQFDAPENGIHTLSITINFTNIPGGADLRLKTIRITEDGEYYLVDRAVSNNVTIIQQNFGYHIAKSIAIIPINAGNSGVITYTRRAELLN